MSRRTTQEYTDHKEIPQGELFSEFEIKGPKRPRYALKRDLLFGRRVILNLSYENITFFLILFIMLLVTFFAFGVEKGKRTARTELAPDFTLRMKQPTAHPEPVATEIPLVSEDAGGEKPDSGGTPYTIQVISFKSQKNADREITRLQNQGFEAFVIQSGEWRQICVGRYKDREDAASDIEILQKRYPGAYLRQGKDT